MVLSNGFDARAIASASAGAFATTITGLPSESNVTETELVTTAVTVKLPVALAWAPLGGPDGKNIKKKVRMCENIEKQYGEGDAFRGDRLNFP